jgi:hypothetical protein
MAKFVQYGYGYGYHLSSWNSVVQEIAVKVFFDFRTFCCEKASGPVGETNGHNRSDYGQVYADEIYDEVFLFSY